MLAQYHDILHDKTAREAERLGDLTCSVMAIVMCGFMIRLVPPAIADSHSPLCTARHASCRAVNEEEQAVRVTILYSFSTTQCQASLHVGRSSKTYEGPLKPNSYETLLATTKSPYPVMRYIPD